MKKKIMASVVALLMTAAALPMTEIVNVIPDFAISASAVASVECGDYTATIDENKKTVVISGDFKATTTTVEIDTSSVRTTLLNSGYDLTDYTISVSASGFTKNLVLAHVIFKDNFITEISANMFKDCTNLQTVTLSDSITSIGANAFNGCTNFVGSLSNNTVQLNKVETVGESAFKNCKKLVGVNFGSNAAVINKSAFLGCIALKSVEFPASVETVAAQAFSGCTSLTDITFAEGSMLASLGDQAFEKCTSLRTITANGTSNTLPDSLTDGVGKKVFTGCTALQSFKIPVNMTRVNEAMFMGCVSLADVSFADNSKCEVINKQAFSGCTNLATFSFGKGSIVSIIDTQAFSKCSSLRAIEMPATCVALGSYTFEYCTSLSKVVVSDDLSLVWPGCFTGCTQLSLYPRSKASSASSYANKVALPDAWTIVDISCFEDCTGIKAVDLNKVQTINSAAFAGCKSLTSIDIPEVVTEINDCTFEDCTLLKDVAVSSKLQNIWGGAFRGCTSLDSLTPHGVKKYSGTIQIPSTCSGTLPPHEVVGQDGKKYIASSNAGAFENCSNIKYMNILQDSNGSTNFAIIADRSFMGCTSLSGSCVDGTANNTIEFPDTVIVIQDNAFNKCSSLDSITFSGNVTTIGDYAFDGCESLTNVTVNPTITSLGSYAFRNCKKLQNMPLTTTGKTALSQLEMLNKFVFSGCSSLTYAEIPASVTTISDNAFSNCTSLERVQFTGASNVDTIGNNAFSGCTSLKLASTTASGSVSKFPGKLSSIGSSAFNNTALTDIKIVKSSDSTAYTTIGSNAFQNCKSLVNADLSETNLSNLSSNVFISDAELVSVKLPSTLNTIDTSAFKDCVKLSMINSTTAGTYNLPANLVTINATAFQNNHCMSELIIPASVKNIALSAFNITLTYSQEDLDSGKYKPLKAVTVDSANTNYSSSGGVLFNKDKTQLLLYPYMKTTTRYTVPNTVLTIGDGAFMANQYLEKVTLNENLSSIGKGAFTKLAKLYSIYFGSNSTVTLNSGCITGTAATPVYLFAQADSTASKYSASNVKFLDNDLAAASVSIKEGSVYSVPSSNKNQTVQLTPVVLNSAGDAATDVLKWTSSDVTFATVDNNGKVTVKANASGSAKITVTTASKLTASITIKVASAIDANTCEITGISSTYPYTGSAVKPVPTVTYTSGTVSKTLVQGTDYTVSYSNNVNPGTATMTITGKGAYAGSITKNFTIGNADFSKCTVTLSASSCVYTGAALKPKVTVKSGDTALTEGTDYTVSYTSNVNVGTATVTVTGKGAFNGTLKKTFTITQRSIANCVTELSSYSRNFSGVRAKPTVKVTNNGVTISSANYTAVYKDNLSVGTATVTITGKGNLKGSVVKTFKIVQRSVGNCDIEMLDSYNFNGSRIVPSIKVYTNGVELYKGNYTVSCVNNLSCGTATMTIKGQNNLKGEVTKTFKIVPRSIANCNITFDQDKYYFTGSRVKPAVTVSVGDKTIFNGNYVATYADNLSAGTATVTLTGTGNLKGTVTKTFKINPRSVATCTVTLTKNTKDANKPIVKVTYFGRDIYSGNYTVTYNVKNGKGTVTLTGKNNLTGTKTVTYNG